MLAGAACGRGQHVNADGAGTGAQAIGGKTRGCLTDRCSQQVKKLHQRQQPILHCRNNTHVNFSQISHPGDFDEFKVRVDAGQRNALLMRLSQTQIASATVKGMVPVF